MRSASWMRSATGMRYATWTVLLSAAAVLTGATDVRALTGREIVERVDRENRSNDEQVEAIMELIDARGRRRTRRYTFAYKGEAGGDDRTLIRFLAPPDIRGTAFLTLEEGDTDHQWLYLPDLKRSKRIAGSSRSGSFVESDLSNYDVDTENLGDHTYELVGEEECAGAACFKIEARARDDDVVEASGYSRRLLWVDKERWITLRAEYFDRAGHPLKVTTISEWKQYDGLWRGLRVEVHNQQTGSRTLLRFAADRKINQGLGDRMFSKRALESD